MPLLTHPPTFPPTCSKEIEDFPARFHAFMVQVKAEHAAKAASAAIEEEDELTPSLADLRNLNLNASLGAAPEKEPLPPALFHRENTTTLCACSDCAAALSVSLPLAAAK